MREFYEENGYDQMIEIRGGKIFKFSCTCPDFTNRKIKQVGEGPEAKYKAEAPCKHILKCYQKLKKSCSGSSSIENASNAKNTKTKSESFNLTESEEEEMEDCTN